MSTKRRISVDVHEDAFDKLSAVAKEKRVTLPEVCRTAVDVFLMCHKARQEGRRICFTSESGGLAELVIPGILGD